MREVQAFRQVDVVREVDVQVAHPVQEVERGQHGDERGHEDEADAEPHIQRDVFPEQEHGEERGQYGLEEEDQRALHGRGAFHAHEVAGVAAARHKDADVQHREDIAAGIALQEGDAGKEGQAGTAQGFGHGGGMAEGHEEEHLGAGGNAAEACHGKAGVLHAELFAQHGVKCEGGGGEQDKAHAAHIERGMQGVDDDERAEHFQHQRDDMLGAYIGAQDEEGEGQHQNGVAAEQNAHHRGRDIEDGDLIEHHAHHKAEEAQPGKALPCGDIQRKPALFQGAQAEGDEEQAADEKTGAVELHGVEVVGHGLEGDFHGAEEQRSQQDENVAVVHGMPRVCAQVQRRFTPMMLGRGMSSPRLESM